MFLYYLLLSYFKPVSSHTSKWHAAADRHSTTDVRSRDEVHNSQHGHSHKTHDIQYNPSDIQRQEEIGSRTDSAYGRGSGGQLQCGHGVVSFEEQSECGWLHTVSIWAPTRRADLLTLRGPQHPAVHHAGIPRTPPPARPAHHRRIAATWSVRSASGSAATQPELSCCTKR